jgi:predicted Zn-dependent protease
MDVLSAFKKIALLESELETVESSKNSVQQDHVAARGKVSLLEAVIERMKEQRKSRSDDCTADNHKVLELEARNERISRENDELRQQVMVGSCCCDFLLLIDVNEWINNECDECVLPHLNICDWFTRSHPSKGENRTRIRSENARVNGACSLISICFFFTFKLRRVRNKTSMVEDQLSKSLVEKSNYSERPSKSKDAGSDNSVEILLSEVNKYKQLYENAVKTSPGDGGYKRLLEDVQKYKDQSNRAEEKLFAMLEYEVKYNEAKVD